MPDIQEAKCIEFTGGQGEIYPPPLDLFLYIYAHVSLFMLILNGTPCKNKFWS